MNGAQVTFLTCQIESSLDVPCSSSKRGWRASRPQTRRSVQRWSFRHRTWSLVCTLGRIFQTPWCSQEPGQPAVASGCLEGWSAGLQSKAPGPCRSGSAQTSTFRLFRRRWRQRWCPDPSPAHSGSRLNSAGFCYVHRSHITETNFNQLRS